MEIIVSSGNCTDCVYAPDGILPDGVLPHFTEGYANADGVRVYLRVQSTEAGRLVLVVPEPAEVVSESPGSTEEL